VSAIGIAMAIVAGFLLGLRLGLALGHRNAKKMLARERERLALKR
jgi:hypothetical protein